MKHLALILAAMTIGCGCAHVAAVEGCAVWTCKHEKDGPTECTCLEAALTERPKTIGIDCSEWECKHDASGVSACACISN
jgi:hypothetical protein